MSFEQVISGAQDRVKHLAEVLRAYRNKRYEVLPDGRRYLTDLCAYDGGWLVTKVLTPDGQLIQHSATHNMLTTAGRNHIWGVVMAGGPQTTTWYLVPFSNNVTPGASWTPTSWATEFTNYTQGSRPMFDSGAISSGNINNEANPARITAGAGGGSVYGFAIMQNATKSNTSGIILAAARDENAPINLAENYKLDTEYHLSLTSS